MMPRFVLLEHEWNGLHWDLMLEVGDVLRTWAIDRPLEPGIDLPARDLADHRLVYLTYEGEISGNRGSVRRLDQGMYHPLIWQADRVRVKLFGAQLVGSVELRQVGSGSEGAGSWYLRIGNLD
jgi:hypothetical protein